ncbi:MAG: nucleotidyltransferase domain-containing protein [Methanothrix sp.]|jgi:predicted nucleotidyltransferase|uniref:Nucleotidyltransferase, putative n=1 Tax=Methanothrix harundinacea TaxID=301375 RepID=A0A117LFP4_9EURY|nr:MAG: nucleotidyltransferase [Methanosaeta sp. SDB]KUK44653.1 MAG: Nucleotidyltransferase, putative [Methanothrix harundinacea]MDD2638355.1 nucleotidyltransferase domain-containing protein [Methanothrix sp.]MDI9399387.1 nucleotidyltransferase domain-containing protein [Euryarchaeota archaeon]KUK96559.1 MAG: Nucleotidyltransferase, putative [Methanothrix harundinacea]
MTVTGSEISLTDESRHKAIEEFVRRATREYGDQIRSITLFGSVARGNAAKDSDIDLLVVIDEEDFRLRRKLVGLSFDILLETGGDLSVKVLSYRDFQAHKSHSFLRNVLAEGAKLA